MGRVAPGEAGVDGEEETEEGEEVEEKGDEDS
jgi:hypothetical protein